MIAAAARTTMAGHARTEGKTMRRTTILQALGLLALLGSTTVLRATAAWAADPKALLAEFGFPADSADEVMAGKFVDRGLPTTNDRDLNVGVAFLVRQTPEEVTRKLREESLLLRADPAQIAFGELEGQGSFDQLAGLKLTPKQLAAYAAASVGSDLNLSSEEIAGLTAAGKDAASLQKAVTGQLLTRYRAYRARGLDGIAPYDRGGSKSDPAADLRSDNAAARKAGRLPKGFYDLLDNHPKSALADLQEKFRWSQFTAHGEDTVALVHSMMGTVDGHLVAVQRQFYVSTGYNVEQAIVGFLPVDQGTLVIYTNHTSTDQVSGFGGGTKRSIGRKLMASELEKLFDRTRAALAK
jgi:hypothetical protein